LIWALKEKLRTNVSDTVIDYAKPLIAIEFMTRVVHDACLSQNYTGAKDIAVELAAEVKLLINALAHMASEQERIEAERVAHRGRV
jgi:hypothetical protein